MDKEELKNVGDIFGWIGTVITFYFFAAPGVPFYKLLRGQIKLNEAPGFLLVFSFLNCILWFNYGLLLDRPQMYSTNGVGSGLTLIFVTIFIIFFTKQKYYIAVLCLFGLIALIIIISYLSYFVIYYKYVGYSANVFNVLMYIATGEKIYRVFKTKNYNLMPIFSIVGAFLASSCWLLYGSLDYEINVIIPNALGVVFSIIQLVVYFYFYCKKKTEEKIIENDASDDKLI